MFGDIPESDYKPLSEVCSIITDGTHQPPKFVDEGVPFLLVSNITGNVITYETPKFITKETYDVLIKRTPIEIGDILLSTVGSYGHAAIVKEERPFCFQRHIAYLKPDHNMVDSTYLHTTILSAGVQKQIEVLVLGVAQKTLNLSAIKGIRIPVPTMDRQQAFNHFVEQSDKSKHVALRATLSKLVSCTTPCKKGNNNTILRQRNTLRSDIWEGLNAETSVQQKQSEYYLDKLLPFKNGQVKDTMIF